jgi:hypothetical protein
MQDKLKPILGMGGGEVHRIPSAQGL